MDDAILGGKQVDGGAEGVARPAATAPGDPGTPPASELGRGTSVGRYLLLGLLGKGGMGEVYAAYDPELDRKVALKLLRAQTSAGVDPTEGRARLLREAQAIARLSDPNVVVVFDVGTFDDRVFLAMEFVDGNTLGYWVHAQPRAWRDVVATFAAAGSGLASAHRAGVVHRDFKPDNVMIGHDGKVRVMDFGLARTVDPAGSGPTGRDSGRAGGTSPTRVGARFSATRGVVASAAVPGAETATDVAGATPQEWTESDTSTRNLSRADVLPTELQPAASEAPLTESGAMMGTPAYMAPEQFDGKSVDARTDQFSFCVALYEALYGERPFSGKNIQQLTANVMAGRVREPPAQARVPKWLRKVILRGLRVDRTHRHPSMEALLAELGKDPARTRRRWAAAGSVAAVIALLGVGLVRAQQEQRNLCRGAGAKLAGIWELPTGTTLSPRKEAVRRAFMATEKRYAADSFAVVRKALDRYVTEWNAMHRDSCEATNVRGEQSAEVLDLRTTCLNDRFSEVKALTNVLSDANGEVVTKSVEAVQTIRPVEQCADVAALRAVVRPPDDPAVRRAVADVRASLAEVKALANAGRYEKALKTIPRIVESAERTNHQPVIAETLLHLAGLQLLDGDAPAAEANYEKAVWMAEANRHDEVAVEAAAQLIFAVGYLQDRSIEGERWARYCAAVLHRLGPGHEVVSGWRANNLAIVFHNQGRSEEALKLLNEAVTIKTRGLGAVHHDVAVSLANLAYQLYHAGRIDEAIEKNERALQVFRATLGPDHPGIANAVSNGAEFLNAVGRYAEAQTMAENALAILERELPAEHLELASPLTALGVSWVGRETHQAALVPLERALAIRVAKNQEPGRTGETRFALAKALWGAGRSSQRAKSLLEQATADFGKDPRLKHKMTEVALWLENNQSVQRLSMR